MRSDKGNNTVVMKKEEYLNEMHKMLQNKDIYQVLNKDPTSRFEKLANNLITKLRKESIITEKVEKSMKSYNSVAPKIYGLRKTHKQNLALRPVKEISSDTLSAPTPEERECEDHFRTTHSDDMSCVFRLNHNPAYWVTHTQQFITVYNDYSRGSSEMNTHSEQLIEIAHQLKNLCNAGGFPLTKWQSIKQDLLRTLSPAKENSTAILFDHCTTKILRNSRSPIFGSADIQSTWLHITGQHQSQNATAGDLAAQCQLE
ncbi:hypothetical protein M0804_013759 [Polistes exclamans]|nr:hypothetical protein M0804_013759 [Polistes exclamans]